MRFDLDKIMRGRLSESYISYDLWFSCHNMVTVFMMKTKC